MVRRTVNEIIEGEHGNGENPEPPSTRRKSHTEQARPQ
jgi:hypothetical protein